MKTIFRKKCTLSDEDINTLMSEFESCLSIKKINSEHAKKTMILLEECLLNFQKHFGEEKEIKAYLIKQIGKYSIEIKIKGEEFTPFSDEEDEDEYYTQIIKKLDIEPKYAYSNLTNTVSCEIKKEKNNFLYLVVAAAVLGILCGIIGKSILSVSAIYYVNYFFSKVSETILGLLAMTAGPFVFFSIYNSVLGVGNVGKFSKIGKSTLGHFLFCDVFFVVISVVTSVIAFPLSFSLHSSANVSRDTYSSIVDAIFGIFPNNFFGSFVEGNIVQILILALLFGIASIMMIKSHPGISECVSTLTDIVGKIMGWFTYLLPIVIFASLATNIINGDMSDILKVWYMVVVVILLIILFYVAYLIIASIKCKVSIKKLCKDTLPLTFLSMMAGSSTVILPELIDNLCSKLSINKSLARFASSTGMVFFPPDAVVVLTSATFFCASVGEVKTDISWMLLAVIMCYLFSISAPPVVGGYAAILAIMFTSLGISQTLLGIVIPAIVFLDYFCTGVKVGIIQLDILIQQKKIETI